MKITKLVSLLAMSFLGLSQAHAQSAFSCYVDVQSVLVYGNGAVNVRHSGKGDYTVICNLNEPRQGVSITTCAMWTSMLTQYEKDNKRARFYYNGTAEYSSCQELPAYFQAPAPVYIGNGD